VEKVDEAGGGSKMTSEIDEAEERIAAAASTNDALKRELEFEKLQRSRFARKLALSAFIIGLSGFAAIATFLVSRWQDAPGTGTAVWGTVQVAIVAVLAVATVMAMFGYLQRDGSSREDRVVHRHAIERLESELMAVRSSITKTQESALTDKEFREVVRTRVASVIGDDLREQLAQTSRAKLEELSTKSAAESSSVQTTERLLREINALGRRGNLNLVLGTVTTMIGMYVLSDYVIRSGQVSDPTIFASQFAPRLTLAIFIQVFAYFFLRLYKASLQEIKYYQNELTSIGAKQQALTCAIDSKNAALLDEVVRSLAGTDRNHVLVKGQSTVEIEHAKLDKDETLGILTALINQAKVAKKQA
jgi:hypothetical protein